MGYGVLHQPNASRRIGAIFARSKNSGCCGEKIGLVECGLVWDVRRVLSDLLYLKIRRGTQAAQGRGLQNLHSWVRIPPAPPSCDGEQAVPVACEFSQSGEASGFRLTAPATLTPARQLKFESHASPRTPQGKPVPPRLQGRESRGCHRA